MKGKHEKSPLICDTCRHRNPVVMTRMACDAFPWGYGRLIVEVYKTRMCPAKDRSFDCIPMSPEEQEEFDEIMERESQKAKESDRRIQAAIDAEIKIVRDEIERKERLAEYRKQQQQK